MNAKKLFLLLVLPLSSVACGAKQEAPAPIPDAPKIDRTSVSSSANEGMNSQDDAEWEAEPSLEEQGEPAEVFDDEEPPVEDEEAEDPEAEDPEEQEDDGELE